MASKIQVTLMRSHIGTPEKHCKILRGLGLTRHSKSVTLEDSVEVRGMINKVSHMVKVTK